jgi:UDP:flavonoid glycosyltransferase YjiC (YdhE family)
MCHLSPALFRSLVDPPVLPGLFMPAWFPTFLKNGLMWVGDNVMIDPVIGPAINGLRKDLGLPPVKHFLREWWHTEPVTLALFPKWFATAPDWPAYVKQTNFPLYDESGVSHVSPEVDAFINAGDPPIAFTAGSAMVHAHEFFDTSIAATLALKRRALLLTRHPEQLPAALPSNVLHVPYAPFGELLPRCAALVHHGGIGTTAQALKAGIAQLIYPLAHDQPDNANRLERLGVGDHLRPAFYSVSRVTQKLGRLLNDPQVRNACAKVKSRFDGVHPLGETCDAIEKVFESSATLSRT